MGYYEIAGNTVVYALVIVGILYVAGFVMVCMRKAWKRAVAIGFTREKLWSVIRGSAVYSVVPSIAGLVGFLTLAPLLGIPLSWWRLSIVGSTTYEIMAADMALETVGVPVAQSGASVYVLVMYAMAIGIIGGMILLPLFAERVHNGTLKLRQKEPRWGALSGSVYMLVVVLVFAIPMILSGGVGLLTLLTSAAITIVLAFISKRYVKWLNDFILAIAMLGAMASSVLWDSLLK